jgi:hypothetical protein
VDDKNVRVFAQSHKIAAFFMRSHANGFIIRCNLSRDGFSSVPRTVAQTRLARDATKG